MSDRDARDGEAPYAPRADFNYQSLKKRAGRPRSQAAGAPYPGPRETRSISARTRRSTMMGRLSSRHALSIGLSISRPGSSEVRRFFTSQVWVRESDAVSQARGAPG